MACKGIFLDTCSVTRHNISMQVKKPVNVRRRDVLERIRSQVDQYKSPLVQLIRENGDML